MLRRDKADAMKAGKEGKALLCLGKTGHEAGKDHGIAAAGTAGHDGGGADGLENHIDNTGGEISGGGTVGYIAEVGGGNIQGQGRVTVAGNIAYGQVNVIDIALAGQLDDLAVLPGAAQTGAKPGQGAAAYAGAAQMADLLAFSAQIKAVPVPMLTTTAFS